MVFGPELCCWLSRELTRAKVKVTLECLGIMGVNVTLNTA